MLTATEIAKAKTKTAYTAASQDRLHEHDDCIRIAYQWLDAQTFTKAPTPHARPLKHIIEKWAGRYVSQSDVEVAAEMHPAIKGKYPRFNIGSRLIRPDDERLANILEAKTHDYRLTDEAEKETYSLKETRR